MLAAQYALALVALFFLSKRAPSIKSFLLWSLFILLVFFVGSIAFMIYNRLKPAERTSEEKREQPSPEASENADSEKKQESE